MTDNNRDFKGVWIPRDVWLDTRLNALEKIILTEIDSLDMSESGCFASNKYIADFCQCSETKVSTAVSKLIKLGYIYVHSFDGRKRILKSSLSNFERQTVKVCEADPQNLQDNNINNNTAIIPVKEKKERKSSFDDLIAAYAGNDEELRELLGEWLKVRKAKRAAMTDKAIELNLRKLNKLAYDSGMGVHEYLREVICRGWQAFYVINNYSKPAQRQQGGNIFMDIGQEEGIF